MRLFIAVNLPESIRPAIYASAAPLRRAAQSVRWLPAGTLHITLKFLGEVADLQLPELERALQEAAHAALVFQLRLGGMGAFPNLNRPRVFWLGADGGSALLSLQARVETAIEPLGFPREARPFHPHLTLGRVGNNVPARELRDAERAAGLVAYEAAVPVHSVDLMQSRPSSQGSRYEVVCSVPLPVAR